jgi:hypothetical protein
MMKMTMDQSFDLPVCSVDGCGRAAAGGDAGIASVLDHRRQAGN